MFIGNAHAHVYSSANCNAYSNLGAWPTDSHAQADCNTDAASSGDSDTNSGAAIL